MQPAERARRVEHDAVGAAVGRDALERQVVSADRRIGDVQCCPGGRGDAVARTLNRDRAAVDGVEADAGRRVDVEAAAGEVDRCRHRCCRG